MGRGKRALQQGVLQLLRLLPTLRPVVVNPPSRSQLLHRGTLLLGNHQSKIDWLLLDLALNWVVSFVVDRSYWKKWYFRLPLQWGDSIPISPFGAKGGLQQVKKALSSGRLVGIFPEGHLTRNGGVSIFREGWKRGVPAPSQFQLLPFGIVGMWGSPFSYAPRSVEGFGRGIVVFGEVIPGEEGVALSGEQLREIVWGLFGKGWRLGVQNLYSEAGEVEVKGEWLRQVWGLPRKIWVAEEVPEKVKWICQFGNRGKIELIRGLKGRQLGKRLFREKVEVLVGPPSLFQQLISSPLEGEWFHPVRYPVVVVEGKTEIKRLRERFRSRFLKNLYILLLDRGSPVGLELDSFLMEDLYFQPGFPPHPFPGEEFGKISKILKNFFAGNFRKKSL